MRALLLDARPVGYRNWRPRERSGDRSQCSCWPTLENLTRPPGGWAAPSIADQRPLSGAKHSLASLKIATGLEGPVLYCSCDRRLTAPCGKRHGATGSSRKCVPWRRRPVVDCMDVLTKDLSKSSQSLNRTFATCHGRTAKDNIGEVKPSPETS